MKMKRIKEYIIRNCAKIIFAVLLLFFGINGMSQATTLTVISNQKGSPASLKFAELKSIFMGEKQRWRSGTKITIALMKTNTPAGRNTCSL